MEHRPTQFFHIYIYIYIYVYIYKYKKVFVMFMIPEVCFQSKTVGHRCFAEVICVFYSDIVIDYLPLLNSFSQIS